MKTGVKYVSKKYVVNNDYVICILKYTICDSKFIRKCTGKARCKSEDKFDISLGKKLALTRAQEKAFNTAIKEYQLQLEELNGYIDPLKNLIKGSYNSAVSCAHHVDELINQAYFK